ncbi:MAG: hypothetical protein CVU71_16175 [Deltaproteobacteria bacterium HGW-Deltaproteobacteria-6]|nr:MAG: hypothetical protein CVU71_16175 [Deltaproteobacteria bacterium HGW-Deltaproteobacteria-6]
MRKGLISLGLTTLFISVMTFTVIAPEIFAQGSTPMTNITIQPIPGLAQGQNMQQMSSQQAEAYQRLSPAQKEAIQTELVKSGGRLNAEALKSNPAFKKLTPEEVAKGKQLLEQKEKNDSRKDLNKRTSPGVDLKISGEMSREKTFFERSRSAGKYQDIAIDLKPFGFDFFSEAAVRVVSDRKDGPVPLKYRIGPGDEVKLLLWGRINAQHDLTVDRDGKITIPQIGPLFVAGMTFEEMSKQIIKQSEQVVGTNVDISMGSLKTIPVFVLGDVRRPGSYTIGSFATITDALLLAGGPTEIGSMRHVQLKRKGQLITTFDLYDLLLKGDKSKDVTLMAGDVVFVPVTELMVGIAGNVRRPAIYELRGRHDLESIIELAGGIVPAAYTQQIQVERIIKSERQVILDINDKNLEKAAAVKLQDADLIKIFSIVDTNVNVVTLHGNVKRPGKYEIKAGMRLSDLIKDAGELLPETNLEYALVKRLKPPQMTSELIPFNLKKLLQKDPASNIELQPQDQVYVFNQWQFKDKPAVLIEGEIRGDCQVAQDMIMDQKKVDAELVLQDLKSMEDDLRKQGLYNLANAAKAIGEETQNNGRTPAESVRILKGELARMGRPDLVDRLQSMENRLRITCSFGLVGNMRVKDVILSAGGLTNDSYLEKGEIIRTSPGRVYQTLYFNIARAMEGDPEHNLVMQGEDRIVIHSIWEQVYKKSAVIDGEVAKPGSYQYTEGMTVRDLVFKGGNILESAYEDEAEISSIVIEKGQKTARTDRRVINLRKALEGDPVSNVVLQPYDRLLVKRIPDWGAMKFVTISGEFRFPGRYAVHKGEKLSSLIERAGGYTPNAYLRGSMFIRQSVKELQQQNLEDIAKRMERELLVSGSQAVSKALSAEEIKAKEVEMAQKQKFIEALKALKAQGRMTIQLANVRLLKGSEYDIELEDGDRLHIPQRNNVVTVMGAVFSQASYIYSDQWNYQDYIGMAGGYSRYADEASTFVIKVDGSARKLGRGFLEWNGTRSRWEFTAFGEKVKDIEPGDVIIVPEQFERIAWLRELRDFTQILMNTAVVTAVVLKLF